VRAAGIPAAPATSFDLAGSHFLELERFDRVGPRGRVAVLSLAAIDNELYGFRDSWSKAAQRLLDDRLIPPEDARSLRWLDAFGQLIGNTDRHFGNITLFGSNRGPFRLAPAYDMLPMIFAPVGANVIVRPFTPAAPTAENLEVWPEAIRWALTYWSQLAEASELSSGFRALCTECREDVQRLADQFAII
jgi:hypothetical protein